jgi:hypothetical protein
VQVLGIFATVPYLVVNVRGSLVEILAWLWLIAEMPKPIPAKKCGALGFRSSHHRIGIYKPSVTVRFHLPPGLSL